MPDDAICDTLQVALYDAISQDGICHADFVVLIQGGQMRGQCVGT